MPQNTLAATLAVDLLKILVASHGPLLSFETAARLTGFPTANAAHQARRRGVFPLPLRQAVRGGRLVVSTADLAVWLAGPLPDEDAPPPPEAVPQQPAPRRPGRPRKVAPVAREGGGV